MTYSIKQLLSHRLRLSSRFAKRSRKLSKAETKLARSVFGDSIELDAVQLKTAWWVLKNYAVSPNGNIYFHPEDWVADFSNASLSKQSWLIHELTHVWQLQQGLKVVRGAIINRRYEYDLKLGKPFFKYGIEQQARMVQDYFIRHQLGKDCQDLQACIPFLTPEPDIKNDKPFTV
ncbi:type IV secretion protein Rhs [Psychrobacter sp. Cmf 22.2]|uniref:type IV secretion protein Rhs n=1 Tax=Psychrobacter sp. Cmf 22.2 TaxID=1926478 RepID=UPI000946AFF2|nr:type IV secretion protein Rhs [Psychrobacter sp. Cmf 22.2]OLF37489.1 type IV secretion protein Rhs [Psychrobacter sp. Cmf 22.2]